MQAMLIQKIRNYIKNSQRGAAMVLFAILLPFLMGMMGLAIDLGLVYSERAKLQDIADAAALAGGAHLKDSSLGNVDPIKQAVEASVNYNGLKPEGGVGTLAGSIELADNQNLVVTAGKAYAGNKVDDAPPQAAADGTTSTLDRVRVRIAKRVPTFFLNVFSDKYKNGFPVQVAAAATGGSEPAGFKIVGRKGVYVNFTNFANTTFEGGPYINDVNVPNKMPPDKYVDGSVYAGPLIRVSATTDNGNSSTPENSIEYISKGGTIFTIFGVNSLTVNGDIFAERFARGMPNTKEINSSDRDYLENMYAKFRYLINPEGGSNNWMYIPLSRLTRGKVDIDSATTSAVKKQSEEYDKKLQESKQSVIKAAQALGASVGDGDLDGALNWFKAKTAANDPSLMKSNWRYYRAEINMGTQSSNDAIVSKINGLDIGNIGKVSYDSHYNVVVDMRGLTYSFMATGEIPQVGVCIDTLLVVGDTNDSSSDIKNARKTFDFSSCACVVKDIYSETRLSFGYRNAATKKVSDRLTNTNNTWGNYMTKFLSDQSRKDSGDYFSKNSISNVKAFMAGVIYSKGDIVYSNNGSNSYLFGKDSIIYSEDSVLFGYNVGGMRNGSDSTNKLDPNDKTKLLMRADAGIRQANAFAGFGDVPDKSINYNDFVIYKDSTKTGEELNNPNNQIGASMYVYKGQDDSLLPCAIVNGQVIKPDIRFTYDGKQYNFGGEEGIYKRVTEDGKKTISIDMRRYFEPGNGDKRVMITNNSTGAVEYVGNAGAIVAYFDYKYTDTDGEKTIKMKFASGKLYKLQANGSSVERSYDPWWYKSAYGPGQSNLSAPSFYNYDTPSKFMRRDEKREDFFDNYAEYLLEMVDWTNSNGKFGEGSSNRFNVYYGDTNRPTGGKFYHEWEKGEPRKGGKLALVE